MNDHASFRETVYEPRIRLVPFDEIKLGTERRDLVKGIIPRTGLIVVWGPPKSGKSFWIFDVALHIALGWEYRGRRIHQGTVVYCAFEGQAGIEARVEAFRQRFLAEQTNDVPFFLEPLRLDLVGDHRELIAVIHRQLGDRHPVAVVLDTLNRSLRGSESNDEDMSAYVAAADAIREAFSCALIIVHHCGIEGSRPRGHTSLSGAADAQLSVKRDGADNIVVEVELMKDGPQGDVIVSRLEVVEVGTDEDGAAIMSCVIVPVEEPATAPRPKSRPMSKAATIALRALTEALSEAGESAPTLNHIPTSARVVSFDLWRRYAYQRGISAADTTERAKQKAFKTSSEALIASGAVGIWESWVWRIE